MATKYHTRNPDKHEYEVEKGSGSGMVFVGNVEKTALKKAVEILSRYPDEKNLRLYHTYPAAGPQRRYVGTIDRDGNLHRAG